MDVWMCSAWYLRGGEVFLWSGLMWDWRNKLIKKLNLDVITQGPTPFKQR